jgi:hypothetical protein
MPIIKSVVFDEKVARYYHELYAYKILPLLVDKEQSACQISVNTRCL